MSEHESRVNNRLPAVLKRLRFDPSYRRRIFLVGTGTTIAVTMLVTAILTVIALTSTASTADRIALEGDVLVGETLLLAVIAALVALLAYAVSTGIPDLYLSAQFEGPPNTLMVTADTETDPPRAKLVIPITGRIMLRNESSFSAKNPALIIRAHGLALQTDEFARLSSDLHRGLSSDLNRRPSSDVNWITIDQEYCQQINEFAATAVQWDGGATYAIHGHSIRKLPDLDILEFWLMPEKGKNPALTFEIFAEGYRKEITLPVYFIKYGTTEFPELGETINPPWL
jgi:hypothetical protein